MKKKAPQDATLRNIRAAAKRLTALEEAVSALLRTVAELERRLDSKQATTKW